MTLHHSPCPPPEGVDRGTTSYRTHSVGTLSKRVYDVVNGAGSRHCFHFNLNDFIPVNNLNMYEVVKVEVETVYGRIKNYIRKHYFFEVVIKIKRPFNRTTSY